MSRTIRPDEDHSVEVPLAHQFAESVVPVLLDHLEGRNGVTGPNEHEVTGFGPDLRDGVVGPIHRLHHTSPRNAERLGDAARKDPKGRPIGEGPVKLLEGGKPQRAYRPFGAGTRGLLAKDERCPRMKRPT